MKKHFLSLAIATLVLCVPVSARAQYTYIHNDGEYSITLPDAPTGETIWADGEMVPYLDNLPKYGAVGERSRFDRTDITTGDTFRAEIIFLKAERDFLLSLTAPILEEMMKEDFKLHRLDKQESKVSVGQNTIKWGVISGYTVDKQNNLLYHAGHYLTGLETLTVLKISYNVENKRFNDYYQAITKSIKYAGK